MIPVKQCLIAILCSTAFVLFNSLDAKPKHQKFTKNDTKTETSVEGFDEKWFTYYYLNPQPELLESEIRKLAQQQLLSNEMSQMPFIGFTSTLFIQNPTMVPEWMDTLSDIPKDELNALYASLWYADTEVTREVLAKIENLPDEYLATPPEIDSIPITAPHILDFYWGRFMASGDRAPIRQIITALEYSEYSGAVDAYKTSDKTEADRQNAFKDSMFQAATWSLESNGQAHQWLKELYAGFMRSGELSTNSYLYLGIILSKIMPEAWEVSFDDGKVTVADIHNSQKLSDSFLNLEKAISALNQYVGSYPPRFENDRHKKEIIQKWNSLLKKMKETYEQSPNHEQTIYLMCELYRQGHNADVDGAALEADGLLNKGLRLYPKSKLINMSASYFYLSIGRQYAPKGEECLLTLRDLVGNKNPEVERGFVFAYLYQGRYEEALAQIQHYLTLVPDDEMMVKIKSAIEDGEIKVKHSE